MGSLRAATGPPSRPRAALACCRAAHTTASSAAHLDGLGSSSFWGLMRHAAAGQGLRCAPDTRARCTAGRAVPGAAAARGSRGMVVGRGAAGEGDWAGGTGQQRQQRRLQQLRVGSDDDAGDEEGEEEGLDMSQLGNMEVRGRA